MRIERPDQVWITSVPLANGFLYRAAILDGFNRYGIAWQRSNTRDGSFCVEGVDETLSPRRPELFNTNQRVPFTAAAWTRGEKEAPGIGPEISVMRELIYPGLLVSIGSPFAIETSLYDTATITRTTAT